MNRRPKIAPLVECPVDHDTWIVLQRPASKDDRQPETSAIFTELHIRNFRLFENLTIKGLRRINLFVGKNNSGKSAAAEAIALVAVPYVPFQLNLARGIKAPTNEQAFESSLRSFFRDMDAGRELKVTAKHSEFGIRA